MIRTLAVVSLLLAGCSPAEAPAPAAASPTAPSDKMAASACARVVLAIDKQDPSPMDDMGTGGRAAESTDPGVKEAGQRLALAATEAGKLWVADEPGTDMGPVNLRRSDAQQGLLAACTNLFGDRPWTFEKRPTPKPSS
ncbi:hypothetical protein V6V47_03025 [Micromonospora sp. CPCC 205539]|uniref:hypothetical protein n=1 Tax=Micromonospora sp. CPCC 205539 TaxID=3122408 RepID=UPI002FF26480